MVNKLCTAEEAVKLVKAGDTVVLSCFMRAMLAEELIAALEKRFLDTNEPRDLTFINGAAASDFGFGNECGYQRLAYEGLLARTISGYYGHADRLVKLINENKIESYNLPLGVVVHLLRSIAEGQKGYMSKIGLGTYIDPRLEGGRMNSVTREDFVKVVDFEGEEYLYYTLPKLDVAFLRGTTADEFGNISFEDEVLYSFAKVAAMAVKQNGGKVIVQVKNYVKGGNIDSSAVAIPGIFVDKIVVCSDIDKYHRQTAGSVYNPAFAGHYNLPISELKPMELTERKVIGRRAAMELTPSAVVNLGIGMPECVSAVAAEENLSDQLVLTVETGAIAGVPMPGNNFGATVNSWAIVHEDTQFDLYDGGGLDICFLGMAEVSPRGDVNVSKFKGTIMGCGGFINITQPTENIVFCATFTAGGLKLKIGDGKLEILQEGRVDKFKNSIEQVTFSGKIASRTNQNVTYVTERAVFKLKNSELELVEIAPGIDLERDILAHMEFKPLISPDLKLMDERLFREETVGIREIVLAKE